MNLEFAMHVISTLLMFSPAANLLFSPPWNPYYGRYNARIAYGSRYTKYVADWWVSLDRQGWSLCPKLNTYLRGFMRSDRLQGVDRVGRLEEGRCWEADEPIYAIQPAACLNANWSSTLDGFEVWALCPAGYYLNGLRVGRSTPAFLSDIEEGKCCRPQNHPNSYEDCYDEDVSSSFNRRGWSQCQRAGYYMTGFYKSDCNELNCIDKFRCCKMNKGAVHGGWSDFGDWSECSVPCGGGIKERRRTCTSPPPANGGRCCAGDNVEAQSCNTEPCEEEEGYPAFLVRPKNTTAYVNDNLWLHCIAAGEPKPTINWSKDEQGGDKLDEERFIEHSNGTLQIKNLLLEDQGGYYCIAANRGRLIQSKFSLVVQRRVCPQGWVLQGNSCFLIIDTPTVNRNEARKKCQQFGGDLAKITSATENQFIFDLLRKQNTITVYGVWLGLHRKAESDTKFYWADDTPLTGYTAWGANEPSYLYKKLHEKCGHMIGYGSRGGKWNDISCTFPAAFHPSTAPVILCQKERDLPSMLGH